MEIVSVRFLQGKESTVSNVTVNGIKHHHILEDADRGLKSTMKLAEIARIKVHGKTAIPEGRYKVEITYSTRFKKKLPIITGVPGFSGIRLHPGNWISNTEGCPLPGLRYQLEKGDYAVYSSKNAFDSLNLMIESALKRGEDVWYSVQSNYAK